MNILKKIRKWLLIILGSIITVIIMLLLIIRINSSGIEKPFLDNNGNVLPNSIAWHDDVIINGIPQRLIIRGENVNNPVLLIVHGGPGSIIVPVIFKAHNAKLEDIFTVCYWEQRGSGLLYKGEVPTSTLTLNKIVDDGIEVTKYLKKKFNKDKIYIEGASWGTTVSSFMVQKNPALFQAYIGIGQMANQPISEQMSYDFVMNEAKKQNDITSINQLLEIGRPPYPNKSNVEMALAAEIERFIVEKYTPHKNLTSFDIIKSFFLDDSMTFKEKFGPFFNSEDKLNAYQILWPTCFNVNLMRDIPELKIPVYIMQGENDHYTETSLAKIYFDSLKAPSKKWYLFKNASHVVQFEDPEKYRSIYINEILK